MGHQQCILGYIKIYKLSILNYSLKHKKKKPQQNLQISNQNWHGTQTDFGMAHKKLSYKYFIPDMLSEILPCKPLKLYLAPLYPTMQEAPH